MTQKIENEIILSIRFYEELNDFLQTERRKICFTVQLKEKTSIKDLIESLGVPHTEVDLILINGISVDFNYHVKAEDNISVYPVFEKMDISKITKLRPLPLRQVRFVLDTHLGKLAKYLRMLGFDTLYKNNYTDTQLAFISSNEHRILLSRDRGLLKRRIVTHGHCVRETNAIKQLKEILNWLDIKQHIKPFTRCINCNGLLKDVEKSDIEHLLQEKTKQYYDHFKQCSDCNNIYWKGTHFQRMNMMIKNLL